ncbi:protein FAR1-RELATED SEQUENCE 4-like [Citrus clementina]|nr:protein FAR1-RELATED SEQUENCE 4-like [Citrus x clementina]
MWQFYKAYDKQEGFHVKKLTSKKGSHGIIRYATFACGCSGKSESKSTDVLKPKPIAKIGCDVRIGGCVNEDGKWIIRTLNLEHNHGLSPDKARYFPCNRNISASSRKHIEMNDCAGINIARNFNSIVVEAGGYENVSFIEKDCRNLVDKGRRLQLGEGDAMTILKYFQNKQAECNAFPSATSISANINSVPVLNGTNFKDWKENMMILLGCMDLDLSFRHPKPDEV